MPYVSYALNIYFLSRCVGELFPNKKVWKLNLLMGIAQCYHWTRHLWSLEPQSPEPVVKGTRNKVQRRDFRGVKWVRLHASTAGGVGSIPGQGTKIPQAMQSGQEVNNVTLKQNYKNKSLKNTCKKVLTKCISEQAGDLTLSDRTGTNSPVPPALLSFCSPS